jgi:hypothetical protein
LPKRKIKEEKPKKRLGKKEILVAPIAMGAAMLISFVIIPNFLPPPRPLDICLKGNNIPTDFNLHPRVIIFVDGHQKYLPDNVGKQPRDGKDCTRAIHTDQIGNTLHIEYVRPIQFKLADFMKVYAYNNKTIAVIDNSTAGKLENQTLDLNNYNIQYSYFSAENKDCNKTITDNRCYTSISNPATSPSFTDNMLIRVEMTSKNK